MRIDDYHRIALSTAIYEGQGRNPTYPALGLAGEAAEFGEKMLDGAAPEQLAKEAGDVLWYIANMAHEMRSDLRDVAAAVAPGCEEFDDLQQAAARLPDKSAREALAEVLRRDGVLPEMLGRYQTSVIIAQEILAGSIGRLRAALRLAGRAGSVCERVKKLYRDDGGELTEERRGLVMAGLSQTLAALVGASLACGLEMNRVAELNTEKLLDRKKQGHLRGDGDDR